MTGTITSASFPGVPTQVRVDAISLCCVASSVPQKLYIVTRRKGGRGDGPDPGPGQRDDPPLAAIATTAYAKVPGAP